MPHAPRLDDFPDVLTVPEAAMVLRVGKNQCYEMVHRKEIPAFKFGRQFRISKAALGEWLAKGGEEGCYGNQGCREVGTTSRNQSQ